MKTTLPIPAYLPDQSDNSGVMVEMKNAYPTVDGWKPVGAFQSISDALATPFKGGASMIATDGTSYLLAGTTTNLYRFTAGSWTSLIGSLSVSDQWRFASFGDFAIAVNGNTTVEVDLTAGTASSLSGAPIGKSITVVEPYVVIGQDTDDLLSVFTSDVNDHTAWFPDAGTTKQPQLAGDEVMGLAGGEYGVVLQRRRIVRMTKTGDPAGPFNYDPITENVGCASKGSVCSYARSVFFLSDSGFKVLNDGQQLLSIGSEKVDRTFQALVPAQDYERIFSAIDPVRKLAVWCVPGTPGSLWFYNYELEKWGVAELDIDGVFSGFTSSSTLEEVSADYPDLDAMVPSLDDPIFAGGNPQFCVVQGGAIGALSGAPLEAVFQLGFAELAKGRVARIRSIRPVTDCVDGQAIEADVRARMGDAANVKAAGTLRTSGIMPIRASGRYAKFRYTIEAGSAWSYAQAIEIDFEYGGER